MDCALIDNEIALVNISTNHNNFTSNWSHYSSLNHTYNVNIDQKHTYNIIRFYCTRIIVPIVLFFGIIGNAVTVAVLRRKRLRHNFDEVEQSATSGLVCLAVADLGFCVVGFISVFVSPEATILVQSRNIWPVIAIYYNIFKGPMINLFVLTSTWLIIAFSIARYTAISDPFITRGYGYKMKTKLAQILIFIVSFIVSIPQFLRYEVRRIPCHESCYCFYRQPGILYHLAWYHVIWHMIGTIIPLIILIYCHCALLYHIYESFHGSPHRYSTSKITIILVSIITLFLLLVCPSMILTFISEFISVSSQNLYPFRIAVVITNLMQSINFAMNFVLYTAISSQFRKTLVNTLFCRDSNGKSLQSGPFQNGH